MNRSITTRLSVTTISATTYGAPQTCLQPQTCCLFISTDSASSFPQTSQILVLPHTCLHRPAFPDLAKIFPREIHPTLSIEPSSSRKHKSSQSGATWLLEGAPPLHLPQNHRALLVSCSFQNFPSLVVHPCSLIGSPKVTIVNHHILWGCHAPFTNPCPNESSFMPLHRTRSPK
jgi:hypothetical protein